MAYRILLTETEESFRSLLMTKQILCPPKTAIPAPALWSRLLAQPTNQLTFYLEVSTLQEDTDYRIWKCPSRLQSAISTFPSPDILLLIEVAAYTGISEKSLGEWRASLIGLISSWLLANATPLGGPGVKVEIDGNIMYGNTVEEATERACGFYL